MLSNGYKPNKCGKCPYYKSWKGSHVLAYIFINETKKLLSNHFDMIDLNETNLL